ncbi:MAG: hypothetical protein H6832_13645 [Planctomycetes bacterium]|nr:hypothetical protein [Planctomycetota bacterium]MCB9891300.1 hypothetical protein [Planctomycetota bacterium]MCB9919441.1 hypothetical protein [Planctomycetota bacterium]
MKRILLTVALLPLASCQLERELNPDIEPGSLYSSVEQPSDLPVPRELGLKSTANQSRYFERGRFRTGMLVYGGAIGLDAMREFLRARLPDHGWELRNEERPVVERAIQHWIKNRDDGVRYLLRAELDAESGQTRLVYDLRTQRTSLAAAPTNTGGAQDASLESAPQK